jgi:hypothetical protein
MNKKIMMLVFIFGAIIFVTGCGKINNVIPVSDVPTNNPIYNKTPSTDLAPLGGVQLPPPGPDEMN